MDFRESCISSFFVHAIAILLLAVVSQHLLRQPESLVVTLSSDTFERALKGGQPDINGLQEVVMPQPPVAAEKETTVAAENPEDADVVAEEKPAAVPEAEKPPETPQTANAVPTDPGQDITELAREHHVIAIHTRAFVESTSQSLQKALRREIAGDPSGGLNEGTAQITVFFDSKGGIGEVWGSSESAKLKSVIAQLDWEAIPSPGAFRLRMNGLRMVIKIEKGEPALYFSAL